MMVDRETSGCDRGVMDLTQRSSAKPAAATKVMPTYVERKMDNERRGSRWMLLKINAVDWRIYIQNSVMTQHDGIGRSVLLRLRRGMNRKLHCKSPSERKMMDR